MICVITLLARRGRISTNSRIDVKSAVGKPAREAEFAYDAHEKRNPFLALVSQDGRILEPQVSKKRDGEIYLEGVIYDPGGSSYAVISGEIVRPGESLGAYQLIGIGPQKIILSKEGKEFEVELKREE